MPLDEPRPDDADPLRTRGASPGEVPTERDPSRQSPGTRDATLRLPDHPGLGSLAHADHANITSYQGPAGHAVTQPTTASISPGQVLFGKYRVVRRLGGGAMGDVWLVRHTSLNRDHALKMIVPHLASHAGALLRFQREFQVMASFHHEHAIEIYDARLADDGGYIDMQYVEGSTLVDILGAARTRLDRDMSQPLLPMASILRILEQLCEVLDVAHEAGIVHRDLKPANLMLVGQRPVGHEFLKVLDFGIAKIRTDPENKLNDASLTGGFVGTPSYSSPEQVYARPVDGRSDLYSVGVLLFEILCGRLPFVGPQVQVMMQHAQQPPPRFAEINPALRVEPALEEVVRRMLAKDPADRPATGQDLFDAFRVAAAPAGTTAAPGVDLGPPAVAPSATWAVAHTDAHPAPATTEGGIGRTSTWGRATAATEADHPAPAPVPPPERPSLGPSPKWLPVAAVGMAALVLIAVVVAARGRWRYGVDSTTTPGLTRETDRPGVVHHFNEIPDGFVPVEGLPHVEGWPAKIRRTADETVYRYHAPRIYLPAEFDVEAEPGGKPDLVEGWPRVLVRRGDVTKARFVRIPGGREFTLGAFDNPNDLTRRDAPAHPVILSGFYMQDREVSNAELEIFYDNSARYAPLAWKQSFANLIKTVSMENALRHPAVNITRREAAIYAHSFGGLLPTEAQWEYAARSLGQNRLYVWVERNGEGDADQNSNLLDAQTGVTTTACGSFQTDRTEQQIFDMAGNVREWCRDVSTPYIKPAVVQRDPVRTDGEATATTRYATRGGSFVTPRELAATNRRDEGFPDDYRSDDLGFRVVIECPEFRTKP